MSLNKVILTGEIADEPKVYYQNQGVPTVNVTLTTITPGRSLPNGTMIPETTEWHNIWLWDELAHEAETQLHKGDLLYVEGSLHTRAFNDRSGVHHVRAEIWASDMEIVWSRSRVSKTQPAASHEAEEQSKTSDEPGNKIPF